MDEAAVGRLQAAHVVLYDPSLVDDMPGLLAQARECDVLIVRNRTQVRGELVSALGRCKLVGRLGVGLDNIDVAACEAQGIDVIPATGANALSVAEYVIACAMMLLRGAYRSTAAVAAGAWPRQALSQGREMSGKTLGVVGFGSIGQATSRLAQGLGMKVLAFDPLLDAGDKAFGSLGVQPATLDDLLARADVVTLHVPLLDGTRGLFGASRIAGMKPGAILINTSRGQIVDLAAVVQALKAGSLGGAAFDVFDQEPLAAGVVEADCPNLILTPHVSGVSQESNVRVSSLIADRVLERLAQRKP